MQAWLGWFASIWQLTSGSAAPAWMHHGAAIYVAIGGASIIMDYRIEDKATGRLVAEAKSVMAAFDYARGRPARVNEEWRKKMEAFDGIS